MIAAQARLSRPLFTADSKIVVFSIEPTKADLNKAKKDKKKPDDMPKNALGLMNLTNGQVARVDRVKSFQVPEDGSGFIAYLLEAKPDARGSSPTVREGAKSEPPAVAAGPKSEPPAVAAGPGAKSESPPSAEGPKVEPSPSPATGANPTFKEGASEPPAGGNPTVKEAAEASQKPAPLTKDKKKEYGTDLILRNTATGAERVFNDVLDYTLSKDAKTLAFTVSSKKEDANGVYVVATQTDAAPVPLIAGKGKYQKLTWDEEQTELAFISDRDDTNAKQPKFKVYLWERGGDPAVREGVDRNHPAGMMSATEIVSTSSTGFRKDFVVSEKANLSFSLDGSRLFLGAAPPLEPEKGADEDIPADEKVLVDLWHWKDDYVQPIQRVRAEQDKARSYRAVYLTKDKKFVQLADESLETISPSNDGRYAIGFDNRAYRIANDYDPGATDAYLVNAADGTRKLINKQQRFNVSLSPGARYATYFDGKDWNSYSVSDGRVVNLTRSLGVSFFNELNDTPSIPNSYGFGGWTKDDRELLLYDRYDIWQVAPDGSGAKNLTDGVGRRDKIVFRYVRLDPKERSIDPAKPLLLRADNEDTRDSGFYRDHVSGGFPEKLLVGAKDFNNPTKAKDADVLMFTASRFDEYPDVWVTGLDFKNPRKVTNGDRQRAQFNWGTSELVRFKNVDGVALKGLL